jgi:hypothetical protein
MWTKSVAAIFLAFPAAVAITGLLAYLGPGSLQARTLPMLLLFFPIWVSTISVTFLARSGARAVMWLMLVCVLGFGLLYLARTLQWVVLPA